MAFYMIIVGVLIITNITKSGCRNNPNNQAEPRTVVECYDGDFANRVVSDDEEDEREDIVSV